VLPKPGFVTQTTTIQTIGIWHDYPVRTTESSFPVR